MNSNPRLFLLLLLGCGSRDARDSSAPAAGCEPLAELCNGVDDDCDGQVDEDAIDVATVYVDVDADGFGDDAQVTVTCTPAADAALVGGDCDDADADVNPAMAESCNNGKDDDCDGTSNGCELAGEVSVDWASSRILTGELDNFTSGLESGDINGDGVTDLFLTGVVGSLGGRGTLFFEGPFEGDRSTSEAYGSLTLDGGYLWGVRALHDFDGDGVPEFAASTFSKSSGFVETTLDFYFGGPGEHSFPGDGRLEGVGSADDISGRLLDDQPVLLTQCVGPGSNEEVSCFFREPWESPSYLEYDAALSGISSSRTTWDAADFDGDGVDELLFDIDDGVGVMQGPIADGASAEADTYVYCDVGWARSTYARPLDLDFDGFLDLVVGDNAEVHSMMGPILAEPCSESDARTRWLSTDSSFGGTVRTIGDANGDGAEDWTATASGREFGGVYVFTRNGGGVVYASEAAAVVVEGSEEYQHLGSWAASAGAGAFAFGLSVADEPDDVAVAIFSWVDAP